jgi:hypothetical protein
MARGEWLGVVIWAAGCACIIVTVECAMQFGLFRPVEWTREQRAREIKAWRVPLPAFGIPVAVAVLAGMLAILVPVSFARAMLVGGVAVCATVALLVAILDPRWARPQWLTEVDTDDRGRSAGELPTLIICLAEAGATGALVLIFEGVNATTIALLLVAVGGGLGAVPRARRRQ